MGKVRVKLNKWSRKLHRWGSIATLIPLALVIGTGILLQVKKQSAWVQPPTMRGEATPDTPPGPAIPFDTILDATRRATEAEPRVAVQSWDDIDRLDVRIGRRVAKVRANSRWEVQVDTANGEILHVAYRRSDLIESLHDGSFFGDWAKLWVFLPNGLILLGLLLTGAYLWVLPKMAKGRGNRIRAQRAAQSNTAD